VSVWHEIENDIVQALEQLTEGGSPLLATVKGYTARDRKSLEAAIGRELMPAAYVSVTHRTSSDKSSRRAGSAAISVILAVRSLRDDDEARIGSDKVTGIYELSEQAALALQVLIIATDRRLLLVDERRVGGEEGTVIWEQRYECRRISEANAPTFGGVELAGTDSNVHVELGSLKRAKSSFSFPGIDGVFERDLGLRQRVIKWRGQLRAADDSALNGIESTIEQEIQESQVKVMVDSWGRSYASCVMDAFIRCGPRCKDELTGQALQDFEIEFTQLNQ